MAILAYIVIGFAIFYGSAMWVKFLAMKDHNGPAAHSQTSLHAH
jgi:hypothetical protein